jgi:hypothetical protein
MDKDMFSGLGQILKPAVRQAEETDAHLYLQKHDRDKNRKKRDQEDDKNDHFDTEDRASVSVDALYAFISNMLDDGHADPVNLPDDKPLHQSPTGPQTETTSQNPKNAQAASAYAHAAETTNTSAPIPPQTEHIHKLDNSKNELLYDLLKEIDILKARNIQEIYIEKADTFQESLINAIMHAKAQ